MAKKFKKDWKAKALVALELFMAQETGVPRFTRGLLNGLEVASVAIDVTNRKTTEVVADMVKVRAVLDSALNAAHLEAEVQFGEELFDEDPGLVAEDALAKAKAEDVLDRAALRRAAKKADKTDPCGCVTHGGYRVITCAQHTGSADGPAE